MSGTEFPQTGEFGQNRLKASLRSRDVLEPRASAGQRSHVVDGELAAQVKVDQGTGKDRRRGSAGARWVCVGSTSVEPLRSGGLPMLKQFDELRGDAAGAAAGYTVGSSS